MLEFKFFQNKILHFNFCSKKFKNNLFFILKTLATSLIILKFELIIF